MFLTLIATKAAAVYQTVEFYTFFAATCATKPNFFGFPAWYEYLPEKNPKVGIVGGDEVCSPHLSSVGDVWLIGLAVVEIMLRVAVILAIIFVMIAGLKYVNSRGNAEKTESAKKTLVDALIGMVIAISATAVISFIGGRF
jgi:hypothetical protein